MIYVHYILLAILYRAFRQPRMTIYCILYYVYLYILTDSMSTKMYMEGKINYNYNYNYKRLFEIQLTNFHKVCYSGSVLKFWNSETS